MMLWTYFLNGLIVLVSLSVLIYLSTQKHWLSQAWMHLIMGVGLYVLEIQAAIEQNRCAFSWENDWISISQQVDMCVLSCSGNFKSTIVVAQILLLSGVLALLLIPLLHKHQSLKKSEK